MAQFKSFDPKVEVNGQTVLSVVAGMGHFKDQALKILADNKIANPAEGQWYPQQAWLDAFKVISEKIGAATLLQIGKSIPEHADWPPTVKTIEDALGSVDIAYHMNHRIGTTPLFDPSNGSMKEGIGHYRFEKTGDRSGKMMCENPYPCDFDKGIVEAVAKKFKPSDSLMVKVDHTSGDCRKNAGEKCTYTITW